MKHKDLKMIMYFENVPDYLREGLIKTIKELKNLPLLVNCDVWEDEE